MEDSIRVLVCLQALGSVAFAYSFSFILLEITVSPALAIVHCLLCVRCTSTAVRRWCACNHSVQRCTAPPAGGPFFRLMDTAVAIAG